MLVPLDAFGPGFSNCVINDSFLGSFFNNMILSFVPHLGQLRRQLSSLLSWWGSLLIFKKNSFPNNAFMISLMSCLLLTWLEDFVRFYSLWLAFILHKQYVESVFPTLLSSLDSWFCRWGLITQVFHLGESWVVGWG